MSGEEAIIVEIRRMAYELHVLASGYLGIVPLPAISAPITALTSAQHRVMPLLAVGRSNSEIAFELKISEKTVRNHITEIYQRLGTDNRVMAALIYRQSRRNQTSS